MSEQDEQHHPDESADASVLTEASLPDVLKNLSPLLNKLPLSFMKQLDEWAGEAFKVRRLLRLAETFILVSEMAEERGKSVDSMRVLADHVGLPWAEKASLRDDQDLRKAWANLFFAAATQDNGDLHANCVHILGEMNPWDTRVLDYMVRNAVVLSSDGGDGYIATPVYENKVISAIASEQECEGQTHFSIQNLIRLGCLSRIVPAPIDTDGQVYGTLREALAVSVTGVNLYCLSTGQELHSFAPILSEEQIKERVDIVEVTSGGRTAPAVALGSTIRMG